MKNLLAIFHRVDHGNSACLCGRNDLHGDGFCCFGEHQPGCLRHPRKADFPMSWKGTEASVKLPTQKTRGLLDGDSDSRSPGDGAFHPDDPLTMEDALLWLYRTRNVEELDAMQREHLPEMMERYSIRAHPISLSLHRKNSF